MQIIIDFSLMRFCGIHHKALFPTRAQATYLHDEFEKPSPPSAA